MAMARDAHTLTKKRSWTIWLSVKRKPMPWPLTPAFVNITCYGTSVCIVSKFCKRKSATTKGEWIAGVKLNRHARVDKFQVRSADEAESTHFTLVYGRP